MAQPAENKLKKIFDQNVEITGTLTVGGSAVSTTVVDKNYVDALNVNADTLDGIDSTGFVKQLLDVGSPNYTTPSSRRVNPNASNPTSEHYAVTTFGNDGNVTGQLATHFVHGDLYSRAYNSNWSNWKKYWNDTDFTTVNVSNWNTAYSWGNWSTGVNKAFVDALNVNADTLDSLNSTQFLRSDTSDTMSGTLTIDTGGNSADALVIRGESPTISFIDQGSSDDFYVHVNGNNFFVLRDTAGADIVGTGYDSPHPLQLEGDTNIGYLFGNKIWSDGNDGSGSGLDADLLDGQQGSYYAQASLINTNIKYLGTGVSYDIDRTTKVSSGIALYGAYSTGSNSPHSYDFSAQFVGNSRGFELSAAWHTQPRLQIRTLRDCCDNWSSFYDVAIHGLNNGAGALYATGLFDSNNTGYYLDPASTSNLNALKVNSIYLDRQESALRGINWYSSSYTAWSEYMSPSGATSCGPTANITAPSGSIVTSWAQRTFIENSGNYGWTWESGSYNGQPSVVAEIRSSDGLAQFNGGVRSPIFYDSNNTAYYLDPASGSYLNYLGVGAAPNTSGSYVINMGGNIDMNNNGIDYASQLHFNSNVRFYQESNDSYLNFKYGDATQGGIRIRDNSSAQRGVLYASTDSFGLLDSDGSWALRTRTGTNALSLYCDNNEEFQVHTSYTLSLGSSRAPLFYDSNDTGYYLDPAGQSRLGNIERNTHSTGFLVGSYNTVGDNSTNTNPIYAIGDAYKPTDTSLSNMYGIGYTHGGNAPFVSLSGATSWGMYVASAGSARIFLDAGAGVVVSTGSSRAPIFYDSNNTGYYTNPASTSNLNQLDVVTLNVSGTLTGTASGNLTNTSSEHLTYVNRIHSSDGTSPDNFGYSNRYQTFNYGVSSGVVGPLLSFGGLGENYPMQITGAYNSSNGTFKVRTRNGDTANWNAWRTLWHDGNDGSGSGLDADLIDGIDSSRIVFGGGSSKINSQSNANSQVNSGFYENEGGGTNWPSTTWYNSINVRHSNQGNYHGFQAAMSYYDNLFWFRSYKGSGTFQAWEHALSSGSSAQTKAGVLQSDSSLRAPIFYDSNNTGYYINPDSASKSAYLRGGIEIINETPVLILNDYNSTNTTNQKGYVSFRQGGTETGFVGFGSGGNNYLYLSNNSGRVYIASDYTEHSNSSRAPIFYDVDDTGFYTNPSDISVMNKAYFAGGISVNRGGSSTTKHGVSLYSTQTTGKPSYGILFTGTTGEGTHGSVTSDWATYLTMSGSTARGWIFQHSATGNVASISGTGNASFNGDVIAYFSDMRLKTKLGNIENPIQKIQSLNGFYYEPNEVAESYGYKKERKLGLSAQEVEAILPEIVTDAPIGDGYKTVDYAKLVPVLIEAIKEQQKQIDELKQLINK